MVFDDRLDAHLTELQLLLIVADAHHRALSNLVAQLEEGSVAKVSSRDIAHLVVYARATAEAIERVVAAGNQLARDVVGKPAVKDEPDTAAAAPARRRAR